MGLDSASIWSFFLVFLRCSAMLLASPIFSATSIPPRVRIYVGVVMSMALTLAVKQDIGPVPTDQGTLMLEAAHEVIVGILIGALFNLILQTAQMAGSILDLQLGLNMSQALNPMSGVSVTVLAQFKYMLAAVVFLSADGHHPMFSALVQSYKYASPTTAIDFGNTMAATLGLLGQFTSLALQIAAPVFAVSLVVDAALGLVSKAVPQMQVFVVGMPAKTLAGLTLLSFTLPALTTAVRNGVDAVAVEIPHALGAK